MRDSLSSDHFSHDDQVRDVVNWLDEPSRVKFLAAFPEWDRLVWDGSWLEPEASGVDPEYTSWVCVWLEQNTAVYWSDGEPWIDLPYVWENRNTGPDDPMPGDSTYWTTTEENLTARVWRNDDTWLVDVVDTDGTSAFREPATSREEAIDLAEEYLRDVS